MLMPDGKLPPVGNIGRNGGGKMERLSSKMQLQSRAEAPSSLPSFVARYSGYAALRGVGGPGPGPGPGGAAPQQYMAVNFGFMSRGHKVSAPHYIVLSVADGPLVLSTGGSPTYGFPITGPAAPFLDEGSSYKASSWLVDGLNLAATYTYAPFGWAEASAPSGGGMGWGWRGPLKGGHGRPPRPTGPAMADCTWIAAPWQQTGSRVTTHNMQTYSPPHVPPPTGQFDQHAYARHALLRGRHLCRGGQCLMGQVRRHLRRRPHQDEGQRHGSTPADGHRGQAGRRVGHRRPAGARNQGRGRPAARSAA